MKCQQHDRETIDQPTGQRLWTLNGSPAKLQLSDVTKGLSAAPPYPFRQLPCPIRRWLELSSSVIENYCNGRLETIRISHFGSGSMSRNRRRASLEGYNPPTITHSATPPGPFHLAVCRLFMLIYVLAKCASASNAQPRMAQTRNQK